VDQQWNLTIQRQLGMKTSVSVGYVGNKIDHMSDIFIFNQKVLNPGGTVSPGPWPSSDHCCGEGNSPTIRFTIPAAFSAITHCSQLESSARGKVCIPHELYLVKCQAKQFRPD